MSKLIGTLLIAGLLVAGANAQDPLFRMFFDTSGNAGSNAAPHPGSGTMSYDNPILPPGGGRLYIYAEFQAVDQGVLMLDFDITIDGGMITQAWNYNGPGQAGQHGQPRWDFASPNPAVNPGRNSVEFRAVDFHTLFMLANRNFNQLVDLQYDETRDFGDTLLGFVDVEAPGEASIWMTAGNFGVGIQFGGPDTPIAFGYGDASVRAAAVGVRTEIAEATVVPEPASLLLLGLGVLALRRRR